MKNIKLKIEILLTILCLGMIYTLAVKENSPLSIPFNTYFAQIETTEPSALEHINAYEVSKHTNEEKTLHALAKKEAEKMIQSGDVSEYKSELEKHGMLKDSPEK